MMRQLNLLFAALAGCSLMAFGWAQVAGKAEGLPRSGGAVSPRAMMSKTKVERDFLVSIGLSKAQLNALDKLNADASEEYAKIPNLSTKDARVQRGIAVADARIRGMEQLLSKSQLRQYNDWIERRVAEKHSVDTPLRAGETNRAILDSLNLNSKQTSQLRSLQGRLTEANHRFYRLTETDTTGAAWYSHEVNRISVEGTRAILTPEQFKAWIKQWDAALGLSKG